MKTPPTTDDLDLLNAHAKELWRRWVQVASAEGYTPPETMTALAGGMAEMIRHNFPQSVWEDHLVDLLADIRFILTGVPPLDREDPNTPTPRSKHVTPSRTRNRPAQPKPRRQRA